MFQVMGTNDFTGWGGKELGILEELNKASVIRWSLVSERERGVERG